MKKTWKKIGKILPYSLILLIFLVPNAASHSNYSHDTAQRVSNGTYSVIIDDPAWEDDVHYEIFCKSGDHLYVDLTVSPSEGGLLSLMNPSGGTITDDYSYGSDWSSFSVDAVCSSTGLYWVYFTVTEYPYSSYDITITFSGASSNNAVPGYDLLIMGCAAIAAVGFIACLIKKRIKQRD